VKDLAAPAPGALSDSGGRAYPGGMGMSRERALAEAFVEAADTLVADFDVIDFLHTLAERCVQLLDVDEAGLMLVDQRGQLHATAASSENARLLELFELQSDAGPCVDCFKTGLPVVNADLGANAQAWPRFAEAAQATGFVSVHALPLRLRETVIGALNLFCSGPGPLSEDDVRVGQALADVATIGILAQRNIYQADLLTVQLQNALTSRVIIEQAKGVLAERHKVTVDAAFALLRQHARHNNLRMSDLARDVADGSMTTDAAGLLGDPKTPASSLWFIGRAAAQDPPQGDDEPGRHRGNDAQDAAQPQL
jgi:transcriptional regulator with GAF, ATPase, and Fis domain